VEAEFTEVTWVGEDAEWTLQELTARTCFSEPELRELVECGALSLRGPRTLALLHSAARLRTDFELDLNGLVLALQLLRRIQELESEMAALKPARG
jgi:chaperone modulatory protein CbpM